MSGAGSQRPGFSPTSASQGGRGQLKRESPLLSSAWLLGCEWWALLARPAHERMNARSCRVWTGSGLDADTDGPFGVKVFVKEFPEIR
jgi:hypothetical protein